MTTMQGSNFAFWIRVAIVSAAAWVGCVMIATNVRSDFHWFPYTYRNDFSFGPAANIAFLGVAVIFAVCLGIPWIAQARRGP